MQDTAKIKEYCERQRHLLHLRADEFEANNISSTSTRAMGAAYEDVVEFITRLQNKKSRFLREQKEAQK